jgi:peptidyl-prolyl cis-trans isomerase A (cyclophilin A)
LLFVSCGTNKPKEKEAGPAPAEYKVRLKTTKGDVLVLVHRDWAPLGADHFYELVKMGFYDGARFFRAIRGFVVQFGVNGDPKLNKDWSEISIKDDPPKVSNKVGTVTYATSGPNTRSTQIFINLGNNSQLDSKGFSPFGEVIQGMENIENFYFAYGDGPPFGSGPSQESLAEIGNDYLDHRFPKLDSIKKATIE